MFGKPAPAVVEPDPHSAIALPSQEQAATPDLIPLSHLRLDLDPGEPWHSFLGRRGIRFVADHIGRDAISHSDARRLLDEHREAELKKQRHLALVEAEAIEADRLWRASLPKGLTVDRIPEGATYGDLVQQAARDALPRRRSMLEESLAGQSMTYHPLPSGQDES
jgi:hypothetical protein